MDTPKKNAPKVSRTETLERLEEVVESVTGSQTPLDAAFAAFDDVAATDAQRLAAMQDEVRRLLRNKA